MRELPTGTVAFLFTDIEGSTTRWEQLGKGMTVEQANASTLAEITLPRCVRTHLLSGRYRACPSPSWS